MRSMHALVRKKRYGCLTVLNLVMVRLSSPLLWGWRPLSERVSPLAHLLRLSAAVPLAWL